MLKKGFLSLIFLFCVHKVLLWTQPFGKILKDVPFSVEVVDRNNELLRLSLANDGTYRVYAKINEVSQAAIKSTLFHEDHFYYWHFGVNPVSVVQAFFSTYVHGHRKIGASTITMQLARKLYKINSRTLIGKLNQVVRAVTLEYLYSKKDILEAYFNIAPYGFNIEGIAAASRIYFNQSPQYLSLHQAMTLAVLPQSPYKRTKHIRQNRKANKHLQKAVESLSKRWSITHPYSELYPSTFSIDLEMRHPSQLPFRAPHLVSEIIQKNKSGHIKSSIDLNLQTAFESLTQDYLRKKGSLGIHNAAILLVDTRKMETLVHIGSANFFNEKISGQVNGVSARRSPGSALKPFIYSLAIEQGLIHPQTMLKDTPTPFGTYTPDNFDQKYSGPLSATKALIHSRNIPAIHLASRISKPNFYEFLKKAHIPLHPDPPHYGLSIALGTVEVTMEEMIQLYSIYLNEGRYKKIKKEINDKYEKGISLLSKETSFLTLGMLRENSRPFADDSDRWKLNSNQVAWKTGTSMAYKDAWSVAIFDHYAIGVWIGNFSGEGNSEFIGRTAAGPLLFKLIDALDKTTSVDFREVDPELDLNLSLVNFCDRSGHLPGKDCLHVKKGWFIPGVSPINNCKVHRRIEVDQLTGMQVCPKFKGKKESKVYEYWSSDLLKLFKQAGVARKQPPQLHSSCQSVAHGDIGPKIISPKKNIVYSLRSNGADSKEIPLLAIGDGNIRTLTWFVNSRKVGESSVDKSFVWKAVAGSHHLRVEDDQGRSSEINFKVSYVD